MLVMDCVDVVKEGVPGAAVGSVCEDVIGGVVGVGGRSGRGDGRTDRAARHRRRLVRAEMAQHMSFPVFDIGESLMAVQDVEKTGVVVVVVVGCVIVVIIIVISA